MIETDPSGPPLDPRRRRALYRAWHRGTREMDLLLGRFADAYMERLSEGDLAAFEALMDAPDRDLFAWVTGREPVSPDHATPLFATLSAFHAGPKDHEQD